MNDTVRPPTADTGFLAGRGEVGALVRAHDWSATSLGPPEAWSPALRTAVELMLASRQPAYVAWGPELLSLYNDGYLPFLGSKHPQALGSPYAEVWPEVLEQMRPVIDTVLAGEAIFFEDQPLELAGRDRPISWFTYSWTPLRGDNGQVAGFYCVATETTEKVLARERQAAERERLARMFEQAPGFITSTKGPEHVFEFTNASFRRLFGNRDFVGKTVREGFPELEGQGFYELLDQVYSTGERFVARSVPVRLETSPGAPLEELFLDFIYEPVLDDAGHVTGIFCEGHDVTETQRAETALRESETRLRALNADLERRVTERALARGRTWQLSPEIMGVLNADGRFEQSNPAWQTVLGWSEAEVAGRVFFDFIHLDDLPKTRAAWVAAIEHGEPALHFENRYRTKDGGWRWLSWVAVPDDGKVYCSARDVTVQKEQEAELEQAQEALRQSQKLEAMGQLTGGVAHDFNNLLTPIIASLDMLLRRGLGSERERRLMDGALQSAERAKTLVQRLLAFARKQPLQPGPVDVRRLVNEMAELIASTSGPRIDVRVELPEDLPPALADANQLEMAVLNLAVNARDAMPDAGVLTISAARESVRGRHPARLRPGHYVRLSVRDTGMGMDKATIARAVEPFFSTKGIGKGTGLGLSMVHGLAEQLGGGLAITSRPGQGTTVDLWLPISAVALEEDGHLGDTTTSVQAQGLALLVDDEDLVRMSTADMLMDLGYEVVEARSADEALRLMDEGLQPEILVTDHLMPGLTGLDLARELRSRQPDLPVLIVSGYAEMDGIAPGFARLTKPFRAAELAARLATLMPDSTK